MNSSNNIIKSDYFLWERFKSGDKSALSEIYKGNYSSLYDYGYRIIKDNDFVKESIQELFFDLISNKDTLGFAHNIRFYLIASLRRKIFSKIKADKKLTSYDRSESSYEFDLELSPEDFVIDIETRKMRKSYLKKIVNKLPAREKEAVYLKFYKNMQYEEITRIMGISYGSARKLVYRAIKTLREMIRVEIAN